MSFVLKMTARELRASWRRLLFFFVCVAIGVGAIVALRSVIQNVRTSMVAEARAMMAADIRISTNRPWTPELLGIIDGLLSGEPVLERSEAVETATMVRADRDGSVARMVERVTVEPEEGRPDGTTRISVRDRAGRHEHVARFHDALRSTRACRPGASRATRFRACAVTGRSIRWRRPARWT